MSYRTNVEPYMPTVIAIHAYHAYVAIKQAKV